MTRDLSEYDIFVSYASVDNTGGWIRAFVDALEQEYLSFTGDRELRVFWDRERIPLFSHWQQEIFNKGIARSQLFLAFLSPNYCASEVCRREWRAWIEREIGLHILSDGAAPIYIVDIPAMFGKPEPSEQETARQIAELCQLPPPHDPFIQETEGVIREFRRRQLHAVQPFYRAGLTALQQQDLRRQLADLARQIDAKGEQLRQAAASESTVPVYNRRFTGRVDELIQLRDLLVGNHTGVIAGIYGLGGIGKTELAFTYAHAYAGVYPGGRYYVRCEGHATFAAAFSQLELDPFHNEISDAERNNEQANFTAVLRAIRRRLQERGAVLLVLDNVSHPELLQPTETNKVTVLGSNLHLLATTRMEQLVGIKPLMLKELPPVDALALLEKFRPFANPQEQQAATEIVRQLGGFALAVELVAARLLVKESLTYASILQNLSLDSLDGYAQDTQVVLQRHNHEKRLEQVLRPTLEELEPAALCVLRFAALLPPDRVAVPWLRELVLQEHPHLAQRHADGEDPWFELIRLLGRQSLLSGVFGARSLPETVRLHRLIGEFLRKGMGQTEEQTLRRYVARRADEIYRQQSAPEDWELDSLQETIPHLLQTAADHRLAVDGMFLSDKLVSYRSLGAAEALLRSTSHVIRTLAEADKTNAQLQRDLSIGFNNLGDVSVAAGDLASAKRWFEQGLAIRRQLAEADKTNAQLQRDLSISFNKLGEVSVAAGDLAAAKRWFEQGLTIRRQLAEADKTNAQLQRDLSISFDRLGNVSVAAGDLAGAKRWFEQGLAIARKLAEADETNAQLQRDLSISFNKLGDVSVAAGDLSGAKRWFEQDLAIAQELAEADKTNAQLQRDVAVSFAKLAMLAERAGEAGEAGAWWRQCLGVFDAMAARGWHVSPGDLQFVESVREKLG